MAKRLFIAGTGTDVGKTFVSALLLKALQEAGYHAGYYKAAMSGNQRQADGCLPPGDAAYVKEISGITQPLSQMCSYVYEQAVSPHLAARLEGDPVEMGVVINEFKQLAQEYDYLTMEGSGGALCPIRFDHKQILLTDIIASLKLPCLVVADARLGTINHVALTIKHLMARHILVVGTVLNRFHVGNMMEEDNKKMCELLTGIPVIGCIKEGATQLDIPVKEITALYR